jgi:glycerophosphoryl diester phosphodiesterase|uniref:GP-PDE domain-containing protein n=1 Tax=viral metagenome TaxID=1070528 RepID=A0A6C0IP54_9ZZZZ
MIKIAHRGLSHHYVDNSLEAFQQAVDKEFDMIELDIQLCSNDIVVYHDTYYLSKLIRDYTIEECKQHHMLSLDDFLEQVDSHTTKLFFDLKGSIDICVPLIDKLLKYDICYSNVYISAFNRHHIKILREFRLPIHLGFTTSTIYTIDDLEYLTKEIDFMCVHWTVLTHELTTYLHNKQKLLFSFTAKEYYQYLYMKKFDIDGIVTNFEI